MAQAREPRPDWQPAQGSATRPIDSTAVGPLPLLGRIVVVMVALATAPIAIPSGYGLLWLTAYGSVGGLLAIRRPRNPIGWILLGLGCALALQSGKMDVTPAQFTDGSLSLLQKAEVWLLSAGGFAAFALFAILMATFPSGRLPSGRWGAALRVAIGIDLVIAVLVPFAPISNVNMPGYPGGAIVPNPVAIAPDAPLWDVLSIEPLFFTAIGVLVFAATSLVVRARRSSGVERQQVRWVATSVGVLVVTVIGGLIASNVSGLAYVPSMLAFAALPLSIGIAVLRYRLFEIDRIISRTLGYAIVSVILAGVFAGAVLGLQTLLHPITQESQVAVAASTLLVAALFGPIRRRVGAIVDQRFDRARYDAARVADGFVARLRDRFDVASVSGELASTAHAALGPQGISVWLRPGSRKEGR